MAIVRAPAESGLALAVRWGATGSPRWCRVRESIRHSAGMSARAVRATPWRSDQAFSHQIDIHCTIDATLTALPSSRTAGARDSARMSRTSIDFTAPDRATGRELEQRSDVQPAKHVTNFGAQRTVVVTNELHIRAPRRGQGVDDTPLSHPASFASICISTFGRSWLLWNGVDRRLIGCRRHHPQALGVPPIRVGQTAEYHHEEAGLRTCRRGQIEAAGP